MVIENDYGLKALENFWISWEEISVLPQKVRESPQGGVVVELQNIQ